MRKDPLGLDNDPLGTLTPGAQLAICDAQELARAAGSERVESVHLLLGALQMEPPDEGLVALLQVSGLKWDEVALYAQSALENGEPLAPDVPLQQSDTLRQTMRLAGREARRSDRVRVDVTHIVIACFHRQKTPGLAEVLAPLGVSADQLSVHLRGLNRVQTTATVHSDSPLAQLTAHGERALEAAHAQMRASYCGRISTLHLLIGVLENPDGDAVAALQTLMINVDELRAQAKAALSSDGEVAQSERRFTPAAKRALDRAKAAAREGRRSHIGSGDLLMGLLPQRALLVERAQFGAQPDDPAAALLRDVDADLVRAIFNDERTAAPATVPQQAQPVEARPKASKAVRSFAICFGIEFVISSALFGMTRASFSRNSAAGGLMLTMVILLFGSGLITCGMLLFSKDDGRKNVWGSAFVGALAGILVGMAVVGVFK